MKRMTLGISVAALMLAGAGHAAEPQRAAAQPETRAAAQAQAGQLFDRLDLNHDGKLDQADRAARIGEMFDRLDTNHDDMISRAEFAAAHQHMGHEDGGPDGGPGHPGMHDGHWSEPGGRMGHRGHEHHEMDGGGMAMLILHRADPGHTGIVTRDAFVGAALSLFDQADTNHDGILAPAEHRAAWQAMRGNMHQHHHHRGPDDMVPPPPPGDHGMPPAPPPPPQ